jgi:tetratricopeptide (TPR) repeat protein
MFTRQHRAAVSLVVALTIAPNVVPIWGPHLGPPSGEIVPSVAAEELVDVKAKQAYARGAELYKAHRFPEAAAAFSEGYSYKPHYAFLWNLALTYHALGDPAKAIQYYQSYLAVCPASATADRAAAQAAIADEQRSLETPATRLATAAKPAPVPATAAKPAPGAATAATATKPAPGAATAAAEPAAATVATTEPAPALGHASEGKPAESKVWRKWWFWTAAGAGLAALGIGLGVGLAPAGTASYREVTWR